MCHPVVPLALMMVGLVCAVATPGGGPFGWRWWRLFASLAGVLGGGAVAPMILAAVFSQNSKSCIFRTAISNFHSSTVVFVFSQILNKIMLSLKLEPQINCQKLPRTRVSD